MPKRLHAISYLVPEYDAGIAFFVEALGFELIEDTQLTPDKRWVLVAPARGGSALLLAKAANAQQSATIGNQAGGRVGFFLETDDFEQDHARMIAAGVTFCEKPRYESYGTVAVFEDPWGNRWDLLELKRPSGEV